MPVLVLVLFVALILFLTPNDQRVTRKCHVDIFLVHAWQLSNSG